MPRSKRAAWGALAAIAGLLSTSALMSTTAYADRQDPGTGSGDATTGDVRTVGPDYNGGKQLSLTKGMAKQRSRSSAAAEASAEVGTSKTWLALNDVTGQIYLKSYTMRGLGDHIQVWVADDTKFPAGDCRDNLGLSDITDAQVSSFVHEFDTNIYPTESAAFSVPPSRDGTGGADLAGQIGQPADYWKVDAGQSDDIVVLVDNVKDANYYDPSTPDGQTYIAGFFYSVFNEYVDRNVMTIDAFDWLHRTGATPPDDSATAPYTACTADLGSNRPLGQSKPHLYEGTFAHEYQHLLEYYADADEESWINEGLSDWAQTLVGYVDPSIAPDKPGADSHLSCFQGFADPAFGGPENSLTEWQDQGGPEILCDYGAAYSFMEYLASHYGEAFMSKLHTNPGNGLAGLDAVLKASAPKVKGKPGPHKTAMQTLHDWAAAMALDSAAQRKHTIRGGVFKWLTIASMNAKINWDNAQAYSTPGAPPNGSDYVRLRKANGSYLGAKDLRSLTFDGASTLAPTPVEWTESATPPDATTDTTTCDNTGNGAGPAALYSGCGENLDRSIVRSVAVPSGGATLSFDALWDAEDQWDYGFVQVSADGGKTWQSLATADTTTEHDPGAVAAVVENLPGFTGDSGSWKTETADLSAYAGKNVLVGFRYITDSGVNEAGFWVRNIKVGATELPSTLAGWQTISQANPTKVAGYTVQLVAYDGRGRSWYTSVKLNSAFDGRLNAFDLFRKLGFRATTVGAIVTQDDPTESVTQYARYQLKVNGVLQPGG
ncbi:peptidase M6 [Nocardioides marmoriginsengisoli]|uniref:Peptidase M6 n=1 Tax=Nocardioides marmoriginsengisoli TaxID=661483 RepID=A0A3N0CJM8_9ACTN|nr:immune inhibitor A domain-containing protein [Nocardioides marmoriginsengisoli]RNL63143.1 peptidase M6 [Nocardioides marmoriginsengisoli]